MRFWLVLFFLIGFGDFAFGWSLADIVSQMPQMRTLPHMPQNPSTPTPHPQPSQVEPVPQIDPALLNALQGCTEQKDQKLQSNCIMQAVVNKHPELMQGLRQGYRGKRSSPAADLIQIPVEEMSDKLRGKLQDKVRDLLLNGLL